MRRTMPVLAAALMLLVSGAIPARDQAVRPGSDAAAPASQALRTEYAVNPLGIDVAAPRLSWQLRSDERGAMQSAYQIQVADAAEALASAEDLVWDSGKVSSERSVFVEYGGPPLESRERYFWRVRTWDHAGRESEWSEPAWWEMGLLDAAEWEAEWIEPDVDEDPATSQPAQMLRREFEVETEVESARLYVTSHGVYEVHLNGDRVGDELFTPGWTSYHERLQYQTFDVTDLLLYGRNAIGVLLGDGWYRGYLGFEDERNQYGESLALLAQLDVTFADGSRRVLVKTDDGWTSSTGPILMSDLYMGEIYDARLEQPGWSSGNFDDDGWRAVRTADFGKDHLVAPEAPPVRKIQTLKAVDRFTTPEGDLVFDIGQNLVGWVRLRVTGPAGTEVTLRHSEVLDSDGNFYTDNLRAARQTTTYILKGEGEEVFEPHFTFQGFRYIAVAVDGQADDLELDDIEAVVIHSDMEPTGHFESSHALVNQLQHNIVWGQKGNFLDVPTDCPQRDERLGWTGDAQVFAATAAYNMDVSGFFAKWMRDVEADQFENGSIPFVVPDVLGAGGATGWADAGVIVPWTMYQRYGDERLLEVQYESMAAWIDFMVREAAKDNTTYIWDDGFHFGDWLAYSSDSPAYPGASTHTDLIATAYFAHSAGLMARTAEVLGRDSDAREYAQLRDRVVEAFREEFVTPRARLSSDTQTAYVLGLAFDLFPADMKAEAASRLAHDVSTRGHLTTGFLGTPDLTRMLSRNGHAAEAFQLLLREEYPSWLYPVTMDATTIWERWDGMRPDGSFQDANMNSFNHYAYGAIGDWLYGEVAGIQAAAPGYKNIVIAPVPGGGLSHARARLQSMYGVIESSWVMQDDELRVNVTIPPNTRATVRLPDAELGAVTEGDGPVADAEGVSAAVQDGSHVEIELGAGRYAFAYPSTAPAPPEDVSPTDDAADGETPADDTESDDSSTDDPPPTEREFSTEDKLAILLADREARSILMDHMPDLLNSPWVSQAMGFPLQQVGDVIPVDVPASVLESADEALRQMNR